LGQLDVVFGKPGITTIASFECWIKLFLSGKTIGSAAIDLHFETLVKARLEQADRVAPLNIPPAEAAWEMMKSRDFQNTKCEHGGPDDQPLFSVPVPKLNANYVNKDFGIENGEMTFAR
jgi:hypothetical protein